MSDETVKYPTLRLMGHILQKGWQAGSVLGTAALPVVAFRHYHKNLPFSTFPQLALKTVAIAGTSGLVLTGVLGGVRVSQLPADGVYDRAYRLQHNAGQNRTDLFGGIGAVAGGSIAAALFRSSASKMYIIVGGAAFGTFLGVLLHVLTSSAEAKQGNVMMEEAKLLVQKD